MKNSLSNRTQRDSEITSMAFSEVLKMFDSGNGLEVFRDLLSEFSGGRENAHNAIKIAKEIIAGKTFAQSLEITDEEIEALHVLARIQKSEGRYVDAMEIYALLTMLDQNEVKFHKGLGLTAKAAGEYKKSIDSLGLAYLMNPEDNEVSLAIAECHLALGEKEKSRKILEKILINSKELSEKSREIARASVILEAMTSASASA